MSLSRAEAAAGQAGMTVSLSGAEPDAGAAFGSVIFQALPGGYPSRLHNGPQAGIVVATRPAPACIKSQLRLAGRRNSMESAAWRWNHRYPTCNHVCWGIQAAPSHRAATPERPAARPEADMSRTVHALRWQRQRARPVDLDGWHASRRPWAFNVVADLRYSRADLAAADREGQRPRPHRIRHVLAAYHYPRAYGGRFIGEAANAAERGHRAALRATAREIVKTANAGLDTDDFGPEAPRTRHQALNDAW